MALMAGGNSGYANQTVQSLSTRMQEEKEFT
jgi:hypothetical protein